MGKEDHSSPVCDKSWKTKDKMVKKWSAPLWMQQLKLSPVNIIMAALSDGLHAHWTDETITFTQDLDSLIQDSQWHELRATHTQKNLWVRCGSWHGRWIKDLFGLFAGTQLEVRAECFAPTVLFEDTD